MTVYTFQNPETIHEGGIGGNANGSGGTNSGQNTPSTQKSPGGALNRPPLPVVSFIYLINENGYKEVEVDNI